MAGTVAGIICFNYRKLEVWEWLVNSICTLIDKYDIDGIRFDSASRRSHHDEKQLPFVYGQYRSWNRW